MKKLLVLVALLVTTKVATAQVEYTEPALMQLSKMKLTTMYLDELNRLAFVAPYAPFSYGAVDSAGVIDMPVNKYTQHRKNAVQKMSEAYSIAMKERLYGLVPYADKRDIVRSILFLHLVNGNLKQVK